MFVIADGDPNCFAEAPENEQPEGEEIEIEDFMAEHGAILEEAEKRRQDENFFSFFPFRSRCLHFGSLTL